MSNWGLQVGTPDVRSIGAIAFGPDDILFIADNQGAQIFAVEVAGGSEPDASDPLTVEDLGRQLAAYLACDPADVTVRDLAVHPRTQDVYLAVQRQAAGGPISAVVKVDRSKGALSEVPLVGVPFSRMSITNAPGEDDERTDTHVVLAPEGEELQVGDKVVRIARPSIRSSTVTDMAYVDGTLLVAGMSNEEFSSNLRRIPFPFTDGMTDNSLEIFHVSHGRYETASPIRAFVPFDGGQQIVATYTCTPVVQFTLDDLTSSTTAKGKTVAELGAMNQPLDLISYERDDEDYILVSNTRHPLIKIASRNIATQAGLTEPKEPVGVPRENLPHEGVSKMARLNGSYVLMLQRDEAGERHLRSYSTASL